MKHIVAVGLSDLASTFKALLSDDSVCITLVGDIGGLRAFLARTEHAAAPVVVLVRVHNPQQLAAVAGVLSGRGLIWAGLLVRPDADITSAGYRAGAAAMVPHASPAPELAELTRRLLERAPTRRAGPAPGVRVERVFRIGEALTLARGHVCVIRRGVVALHGADNEGNPILLGFAGAGEAIIPDDAGLDRIIYVAHTAVVARSMPWDAAIQESQFHDAQSARIASMEAWARAQADPHVEGRILHTLRVLARLVGTAHPNGTFIPTRITHAQLASAVCATRSTVTRLIGTMRQNQTLLWVRGPDDEFGYCLPSALPLSRDRRA